MHRQHTSIGTAVTNQPKLRSRKLVLCAGALILGTAAWSAGPSQASAEMERYDLDPAHTTIAFMAEHLGFAKVLGRFTEFEGSFAFDEDAPAVDDIEVTVQTASVNSHHEARDNHLRSGDFLDVENHPTMTFVGTSAEQTGENTGTVTGDLTLLGETRELTLDVTMNRAAEYPFSPPGIDGRPYVVGVSARGELDRSDFGMTYGVDNNMVGDTIEIIIEFEALQVD